MQLLLLLYLLLWQWLPQLLMQLLLDFSTQPLGQVSLISRL